MKIYRAFTYSSNEYVDPSALGDAYFAKKEKAEEYADLHLMYIAKKYAMQDADDDIDVIVDKENRRISYYDNNWEHIIFDICIVEIDVEE